MSAAFSSLAQLAQGRKVAALGSMLELGEEASALHRATGLAAAKSGIAWVLAFGPHGRELAEGACDGGARADAYEDMESLLGAIDSGLRSGDWVLAKGSRGMRMERVIEHLIKTGGAD